MGVRLGAGDRGGCRGAFGGGCCLADLGAELGGVSFGEIGYLLEEEVDGHVEMGSSGGRVSFDGGSPRSAGDLQFVPWIEKS